MAEYIERDGAIELFFPVDPENDGSDGCTVVCREESYSSTEIEIMLSELPAADVVPVRRGRWETKGGTCTCSVCGSAAVGRKEDHGGFDHLLTRYCPNCGAKMGGA